MKKLFISVALMLCFSLTQNAQNTGYLRVGINGSLEKIERVSTGGYITVGSDSVYKVQIIRWDDNFNMLWKYKVTDALCTGSFPKIVEANDGSFYFMSSSTEHTSSTYILKISSTGTLLWQKVYYLSSGNLYSQALSKASGTDNGFLFGGGQCTLNNYIIKCDANGGIVWQYQYFYPLSTGVITCWSIIPEGTGYVVSSGYNINSLLTMKLDALGTVLSHSAYTYTGMQIIPMRIVKLNATGGYAIMGNYNNSNNNKTEFVAFYNNALVLQSFNELTVTYTQFTLNDITAINNGRNVVVDGSIYDGSAFTLVTIKLANTGSVVWKKRAAGNTSTSNKNVEFRGIAAYGNSTVHAGQGYNEGRVVAVMDTNGNGLCNDVAFAMTNVHPTLTLQSQTITPAASSVIVTDVTYTYNNSASTSKYLYCGNLSGLEENESTQTISTSISPNPANSECVISFAGEEIGANAQITIYSISGQAVYSTTIAANCVSKTIDVRSLTEGLYLVQIRSENQVLANKRLIILR
ncbi:MAG: T9SS type A sorting domain-containing protein [Bacteroidota bacterium]